MTATSTYRIAAAFQADRDPQQDAIIAWLGALPKDDRGGVKRSVMKYHLTRALLLYMQSGADTSTALHIGSVQSVPTGVLPVTPQRLPAPPASVATPQVTPVQATVTPPALDVPILTDPIKKVGGGLRRKIASSMQGATTSG